MPGIKLITQLIFLLLYFVSPPQNDSAPVAGTPRDMSFMATGIGGFYMQVADPSAPEVLRPELEETPQLPVSDGLSWETKYETPDSAGNALVWSWGYEIVAGPYEGVKITNQELEMMYYVVHRETNGSIGHRRIIAEVILNRVVDKQFEYSVKEVLEAPRQFPTVANYYNKKRPPDDITRQAVMQVILGQAEYASQGALYFYDPEYADASNVRWFESDLTFLFALESHRFFK